MSLGAEVRVLDNLTNRSLDNIAQWLSHSDFQFIRGDLLNPEGVMKAVNDRELIYHLAASSDVRIGSVSPEVDFRQNVVATFNLLESLRSVGGVKTVVFTSSSTVYGDASEIPTPEDYAPLTPTSIYGASKLACEALMTAYAQMYGFKLMIYRLANIVGPRSKHGVAYDFIQKLKKNPTELEVLGDGTQMKSYLYISDCIRAMLLGLEEQKNRVEIYNVGSEDQIDVKTIANIVIEEMGLDNVKITFTGGIDGGRGWKGDVKNMLLHVGELKSKGWKPSYSSEEAIRLTIRLMLQSLCDGNYGLPT